MDRQAECYRRFLDGDRDAFDEIMESLFYSVLFFTERIVGDWHTAEDITIDVFADLMVHRHRFNFKVRLKTYLMMLARSRGLDHLRRRRLLRFVPLTEAEQLPDGMTPEEQVLSDERKRMVHQALENLPGEMGQALHLYYIEGLSYGDTARVMKKSVKQVDNLLYRGKKALRDALGGDWQ